MITVNFEDLLHAVEFVSADSYSDDNAYIGLDTGIVYWLSSDIDDEQEIPEDIETSDRYLEVPRKKDLAIGQHLVMSFIGQELPEDYNTVASYFRKKGAYRRFKDLLEQRDMLAQWYAYEANAESAALIEWCAENDITLSNVPTS
jgi:hypothetical protein